MTTKVTVGGTDCYKLAAQYLGDATQWWRIYLQNNLSDPIIGQPMTLIIPDLNPALTGGLPSQ